MDKVIKISNPVTGAVLGQVATCDLPIGMRYHALLIAVTMTAAAGKTLSLVSDFLGLINIKINGKVQRAHTALELDAKQSRYGSQYAALLANTTGAGNTLAPVYAGGVIQGPQAASQTTMYLRVNFAEPYRKSYAAVESRAWPTAWPNGSVLKSLQLELTCATGLNNSAGATGYTINVYSVTDTQLGSMTVASPGNPSVPISNILKIYRNQVQYVAAGDLPIVNLIKTSPGKLAVLEEQNFVCQAGDDINRIVATADSRIVRDVTKGVNDILLVDHHFYSVGVENADVFSLVYDYTDLPTDGLALSTATSQVATHQTTVTLTAAAAASKVITVLSDVYGPID